MQGGNAIQCICDVVLLMCVYVCLQVLHVDAARKRLLLTHKKTLVESSLPLLADYEDAKPGGSHHGVVIAVKDFGCLVQFFHNVRGIVRKPELR